MKQFCETSSIFKLDNIKNEAILRDFLQKWKVECSADGLVPMRCAIFPLHLSKAPRLPCQVIRSAAPVTQNHLRKSTYLMLQNATPLRKSAPWPPNISDEHVSCTAPAMRNASLQILFKCPTPAIVYGNATKPSRFADFWHGAQSLAPATRNEIWTSVRTPSAFNILTWKCASRHSGVNFFDIATSKHVNKYIYIFIQKESRPARFQTLKKSKHMGMSQTEVSVFPLKVAILEPKTDTSSWNISIWRKK